MPATVAALPPAPHPSGLTTEIVKVTPVMAEKWLGKNVKNRNVSQREVTRYARAMERGEWLITGEAVKFAATGELLDGQHRLAAIVRSGRTVPLLVVRGLTADVQDVLDTGRARTASDQLTIHGYANAQILAAAARIAILYESGLFYRDKGLQQVSHRQILDYCAGNTTLTYASSRAHVIAKGSELQPAVCAFTIYTLTKLSDEKAETFFDRLADGVELPSGSPILALRARLRTLRDERTSLPVEAKVGLVFRTWNAWLAGRKLTGLPLYRQGELIPCPEPKAG